jgi:Methylase involved in ubiquinone/menaquinone biosynthesis
MNTRQTFDAWAESGKDRGMEQRHWATAKHALAQMPVEQGDRVVDLGTGSGYALRALRETQDTGQSVGLDGSTEMVRSADGYTDDELVGYVTGDFHHLPFAANSVDHVWSMEAFYYAERPVEVLREVRRILCPGGTFFCAVNFFEESTHTHGWQDNLDIEMQLWSHEQYREAFREAGLHVVSQDTIPDRETEIPPSEAFPTAEWESREAMVDRYRVHGTLLTVGVAP